MSWVTPGLFILGGQSILLLELGYYSPSGAVYTERRSGLVKLGDFCSSSERENAGGSGNCGGT